MAGARRMVTTTVAAKRRAAGHGARVPKRKPKSRLTRAEIEPSSAASPKQMPEPKGELEYVNPFTLLVAVVLSAQATDAGVNKATRDAVPARRHAGEDAGARRGRLIEHDPHHRPLRTKAKNVIALSPHPDRGARRRGAARSRGAGALPGVGRKTANVVLNIAFGAADHRRRHAHLPRRQPHRPRAGQRRRSRSSAGWKRVRRTNSSARASLADPARPLCLQGAQARDARVASSPTSAVQGRRPNPPARIRRTIRCRSSRAPRTAPSRDSARRRRG